MAVITHEGQVTTAIPPATMFKVFALEAGDIIPKLLPQYFKSVETLQGNGEPGTIRKTTFAEGSEFKYATNRVDGVDKDSLTYSYTTIGGEPWNDALEKIYNEVKLVASPDGGSIVKTVSKYYPKGGAALDEDQIKAGEEKVIGIFKLLEAAILANPNAC